MPELRKVTVNCLLCGSEAGDKVTSGVDVEYPDTSAEEFTFVRCRHCELVYLSPRPHESELPRIYPENYHSYHLDGAASKGIATSVRRWVYSRKLKKGLAGLENRKVDLLDVGCGDGWMLDCYENIGSGSLSTFGVEISEKAVKIAAEKGHTAYLGKFEDIDFGDRKFDVINISHVIEHVASPLKMAQKARSLLKPGGRVVLETPNIASVDGWLFRKSWGAYHFPRHWYLFDPKTFAALMAMSGLEVKRSYFHACPVHWHWSLYRACCAHRGLRPFRGLFSPRLIFAGGAVTFFYLSVYTAIDQVLKTLGLPTSNMMIVAEARSETV